jgi:hypothetical protein
VPQPLQTSNLIDAPYGFADLCALFVNCTLKASPRQSHAEGLIDKIRAIMAARGAMTDIVRAVDHDIAPGVYPDMTEHGFATDAWPALYEQVMAADILHRPLPLVSFWRRLTRSPRAGRGFRGRRCPRALRGCVAGPPTAGVPPNP